jgi:hypothetical protein
MLEHSELVLGPIENLTNFESDLLIGFAQYGYFSS